MPASSTIKQVVSAQRDLLIAWLINHAYPLWAQQGIDARNGGFMELLDQQGKGIAKSRRSRIHPRQIFCFAMAKQFGWHGDVKRIIRRGMDYFVKYYRHEDGFYRTLCDADGMTLDDRVFLYDQSFALLAMAYASSALDTRAEFEPLALTLLGSIQRQLNAHENKLIFNDFRNGRRESNPYMHLLEACFTWQKISTHSAWSTLVEELTELAMTKFIQSRNGVLLEFFTDDWQPAPGLAGRIVEPGHQFEWAWLLLRCNGNDAQCRDAALRLIYIGEQHGIRNNVAINTLLDDFSIHDANARLWPQTERIKAAVLAAQITGEDQYWSMTYKAVTGLMPYLNTTVPGLWFDLQLPDGSFVNEPSPASSFYHLVAAILQLDEGLKSFSA